MLLTCILFCISLEETAAVKPRPPPPLPCDRGSFGLAIIPALLTSLLADVYAYFSPTEAMEVTMDPLFLAWSYFRRRKLQQCSDICTKILQDNPYDQVLWGG